MGTFAYLIPEWTWDANCEGTDLELLFGNVAEQKMAKMVCGPCGVRAECLAYAISKGIEWGVWGGTTEKERRKLIKNNPDVEDWSGLIRAQVEAGVF